MLELNKQVVSLESAKRLKELGCVQESLFYWVAQVDYIQGWAREGDCRELEPVGYVIRNNYYITEQKLAKPELKCSAYTVAELGEMLPYGFCSGKNLDLEGVNYECRYHPHSMNGEMQKSHSVWASGYCGELSMEAECRAKMLIHLLENKLMEVKNG